MLCGVICITQDNFICTQQEKRTDYLFMEFIFKPVFIDRNILALLITWGLKSMSPVTREHLTCLGRSAELCSSHFSLALFHELSEFPFTPYTDTSFMAYIDSFYWLAIFNSL